MWIEMEKSANRVNEVWKRSFCIQFFRRKFNIKANWHQALFLHSTFFHLIWLELSFCQLVFHCYAAALLSASGSSWASLTSSPIDYSSSSIFLDISSMRPTILPFIWPNLVCIWSSICVTRLVSSCALSTLSDYCGLPCACASIYCCVFAINF